jgi:hypothetical protein
MSAISAGIGAQFVSVLQPYIHLRKTPTATEKMDQSTTDYAFRKDFMKATFQRLRSELDRQQLGSHSTFIDSTTAFDQSTEDCFYDEVHLTRRGNELLVQYITDHLTSKSQSDGSTITD